MTTTPEAGCVFPDCAERSHFSCKRCGSVCCARHRQYTPSPERAAKIALGIFETLRQIERTAPSELERAGADPASRENQAARLRAFDRVAEALCRGPQGEKFEQICLSCFREIYLGWLAAVPPPPP